MTEYSIVRSQRKTMALYLREGGKVEVRCPLYTPKEQIDAFVRSNSAWIARRQAAMRQREAMRAAFQIGFGTELLYLGKSYPVVPSKSAGFDGAAFTLPEGLAQDKRKAQIVGVYRSLAKAYIPQRVRCLAQAYGATYAGVKLNGAKTRWGSCGGKNTLNFSWRLMMAPAQAVDYVIAHELAHTVHHNHSPAFWQLVQQWMPSYKEQEEALRQLSRRLALEDWDA